MENSPIFYTVLVDTENFPIHYCSSPEYQIQTFVIQASDPGESCGAFEAQYGKERCCYLSQEAFQKKASALAERCRWSGTQAHEQHMAGEPERTSNLFLS